MPDVAAETPHYKPLAPMQTAAISIDINGEQLIGANRNRSALLVQVPSTAPCGIEIYGADNIPAGDGILLSAGQERAFRRCQGAFYARVQTAGDIVIVRVAWTNRIGEIGTASNASSGGGSGTVDSVTAADATIVIGGTSANPTVARAATTGDVVIPAGSNAATIEAIDGVALVGGIIQPASLPVSVATVLRVGQGPPTVLVTDGAGDTYFDNLNSIWYSNLQGSPITSGIGWTTAPNTCTVTMMMPLAGLGIAGLAGSFMRYPNCTASHTTPTQNNETATLVMVTRTTTIKELGFYVYQAAIGGAGLAYQLSIRADSGYGQPGTLIQTVGSPALTATGLAYVTLSGGGQVLYPGLYWLTGVYQYTTAPSTAPEIDLIGGFTPTLGSIYYSSSVESPGSQVGYYQTGVTGAPPSGFTIAGECAEANALSPAIFYIGL
jgi:hypothetical protein